MKKVWLLFFSLIVSFSILQAQVRIKMRNENGIFTTPCKVNGLQLRFIFDTGASAVSISLSEAVFMLKNGYMEETDLRGSTYSQIANGEIIQNTTVVLKELEIGGITLYNIEAIIVHNLSAPLLLGQTAIQKLGKIQLEAEELLIFSSNSSSSSNDKYINAIALIKEAQKYYFDGLYFLSTDTYQKAYELSPEAFECFDHKIMGSSHLNCNLYKIALKHLLISTNCITDKKSLFDAYISLSICYREMKDYHQAIVNIEKARTYSTDKSEVTLYYSFLAGINFDEGLYSEALKNYDASAICRMECLNVTYQDCREGRVTDSFLGELFWNSKRCCSMIGLSTKAGASAIYSATVGYEEAIEFCDKYNLNYKHFYPKN